MMSVWHQTQGHALQAPTDTEYKSWFFDEPECLSSDKENIPPIELVTPPSLKNLSLEEGTAGNETEATSWETSVAKTIMTTPRASSPYPDWPSTLEQLEPNTDDEIIDIRDYSERPSNDKRSPQHKQKYVTHTVTQEHCPTPQTSTTYITMNVTAAPAKPHRMEIWGILPDKRTPCGWPTCLKKQQPRVAFRNNDIYMINGEESDPCEEPQEWNVRVFYKLKANEDPTSKTCPTKRTLMMIIMSLSKKKKQQCEIPLLMICKTLVLCVNIYGIMCKEAYHTLSYERCTTSLIYNIFLSFQ